MNVIEKNTKNSYLNSQDRLVAAIGLSDLIVVETSDAILVANKDYSQEIKNIVNLLKNKNIIQGTEHQICYRPWGTYQSLVLEKNWQVKLINVNQEKNLSLQNINIELNIGLW